MYLNEADERHLRERISRVETRTGVQIVTAIVGKSDSYAELPWKAFAAGAAGGGLAVVAAAVARPQWVTAHTVLWTTLVVLGLGVALALATVFVPSFARLFLADVRRDVEVRQQAQSMFLSHELFQTRGRSGVLVLVSLFERAIEILPDTGLHGRVTAEDWSAVTAAMVPRLRDGQPARALDEGLSALETRLIDLGFVPGDGANELPDQPIQERGI